jgi:hypothetical protein
VIVNTSTDADVVIDEAYRVVRVPWLWESVYPPGNPKIRKPAFEMVWVAVNVFDPITMIVSPTSAVAFVTA